MSLSGSSPFEEEHIGGGGVGVEFPAIEDGHFVFEDKSLIYNENGQIQHELDVRFVEQSVCDYGATVLWKHVIKGKKCGNSHGGSHIFKCKHCQKIYRGTYTRVYAHLMGHKKGESKGIGYCSVVKADRSLQLLLQTEVEQAESSPSSAPLKKSKLNATSGMTSNGPSLALSYTSPVRNDYQMQDADDVDSKVIRCLCANGIPFNVLRSPYWEEMVSAVSQTPGYKSPALERAQGALLEHERSRVEREVDDFRHNCTMYGASIISNGWTDVKNWPLINTFASNQFGSVFLQTFDLSMVEQSQRNISDYVLEVIEKIGPLNVVQLITDNAASCRAVSNEIAKAYPYIFWTPCMVHTLKLILKDLLRSGGSIPPSWLQKTYMTAKGIVKYIVNHSQSAEIFRMFPKLEILEFTTTKWAHYITLRLLFDARDVVRAAVLSEQWQVWMTLPNLDGKLELSGENVKHIVTSDNFWEAVQLAMGIIKPIYRMLKFTDQEGPLIGEVCERMEIMLGEIKEYLQGREDIYMAVELKILGKWNKELAPLQCLAYALTPKHYDEEYLQLPIPGGGKRCKPDQDDIIFDKAMEAINNMHPKVELADTVRVQFMSFTEKKGRFSTATAKRDARNPKINVLQWWKFHGGDTKELRDIAFKVLAQPIKGSSVLRPWSTYSFIHNRKRSKLNARFADDLTYIHSNLRLLSRFNAEYKNGAINKWDVNPEDAFVNECAYKWEDIRFTGLDDENSMPKQTSESHNPIQELLRIIEEVPTGSSQSGEHSHATSLVHSRGRGRGRGGGSASRSDQKGKTTKRFL